MNAVAKPGETDKARRRQNRKMAKAGMALAMGVLVLTGFSRSRTARCWHVAAAGALVGLSAWHHTLYQTGENKKRGGTSAP